MEFFGLLFFGLCGTFAGLFYYNNYYKSSTSASSTGNVSTPVVDATFRRFQIKYLLVYIIAVLADWLQGPYVYALYEWYGFSRAAIARFFIVGFGSSLVFGTFIGALADKHGRKRFSMLYGILYALSCLCKMINFWPILVVGRLLSGISTSLLFSVFDSWMVNEHHKRGFPDSGLAATFSLATLANGIVAVVAGILASAVADEWAFNFGFRAPFALAAAVLISLAVLVHSSWEENYGSSNSSSSTSSTNSTTTTSPDSNSVMKIALEDMKKNPKVALLCAIQSLFEGAMYTFVFAWTPALRGGCTGDEAAIVLPPLGWVFAAYMVGIMIGSQLFSFALSKLSMTVSRIAQITFAIACATMIVSSTAIYMRQSTTCTETSETSIILISFIIFEVCCGAYFPCMGTLKGLHLPERSRSALMNFARVGLNTFLLFVLLSADYLSNTAILAICSVLLACACVLMTVFIRSPANPTVIVGTPDV